MQDRDKYRLGRSKVFFRAGQVAYLERLRSLILQSSGLMIQKHVRGWIQRRRCVVWVCVCGCDACAQSLLIKCVYICVFRYLSLKILTVRLQALVRGVAARRCVCYQVT